MENQEPWEPTFPVGYTLPPKNAYGGSVSACPAPKPAYLEIGTTVDTSAAPTSAAAAAAAASTARAEAARQSSGVRGSSGGARGGGVNWGCRGMGVGGGGGGAEERLNAMA